MRLTTKGRYAVTAMLDLALHEGTRPVSLADISSRQAISLSYLEQLFAKLRRAGLVSSVRGPGGGYKLRHSCARIHIAEIVDAVNESYEAAACQRGSGHQQGEARLAQSLWSDLSAQIHGFLSGISLAQLVQRSEIQRVSRRQDTRDSRTATQRIVDEISVTDLD